MATTTQLPPLAVLCFVVFIFLVSSGASAEDRTGTASWVGAPDGAGRKDNGFCGFGDTVTVPPFSGMVTGFGNDDECGICYEVSCTGHPACSPTKGVRVTVTDSCRSALCANNQQHFDMSGHAFGAMARPGRATELRAAGNVTVVFNAVDCTYTPPSNVGPRVKFPFVKVDPSATKDNFSVTLLYTEGWADWKTMSVQYVSPREGKGSMTHSHGATWVLHDAASVVATQAAVSLLVYSPSLSDPKSRRMQIFLANVVPAGWQPGAVYFAY